MSTTSACRRSAAAAAAALLIAGCGGGDEAAPEVKLGETAGAGLTAPALAETEATAPPEPAPRRAAAPRKPRIEPWPIPFGADRRRQTREYSQRHYGTATDALDPRVIVQHYTAIEPAQAVHDLFARNVADRELGELPQVCSHYLVDTDGTIYELVPVTTICRHTVGLNDVAIGIEHVGRSDAAVLGNPRQLAASVALTAWLRCEHGIGVRDVIGHNESLGSPHHHENVAALRTQTHPDFARAAMDRYRARLAKRRC